MMEIPPFNGLDPGPNVFDNAQFYDSAVMVSGELQVWLINNFPIPFSAGAICTLKNAEDAGIIGSSTLPYIASHDSAYFTIPLAGKKVKNKLSFEITNLNTPGSSGNMVLINLQDYIQAKIFITQLRVSEAWAKFPTQNVSDVTEDVVQVIDDRKLTYVDAREGILHVYITSSVEEQLTLEYTLVGAFDNYGHPLVHRSVVPPAPPNGTVTIDTPINIAGFAINLTGKNGTEFNTYTQRIIARLDSSGITRHVTNSDSVHVEYRIKGIKPNYVKGYLGRDTITVADNAAFSFLDMFQSGTIDLESVNVSLEVENGLGVDGEVIINNMAASSPVNGSKQLIGSIVGQKLMVNRATDFPWKPAANKFQMNNSNSNIKDLIGILPSQISYDVAVKTNVNGNNQQYRDFAYLQKGLKINLNAEVPLSLIANNLHLLDTIDFDLSTVTTDVGGIKDGLLNIIANNNYPLDASLQMVVFDEFWQPVDTLLSNVSIPGGVLDANCKVESPTKTKIPLPISEERMDNLKRGKFATVSATFSTTTNNPACAGQHLKIYGDNQLSITLTARFNYKLGIKL
ncbi:MAG: hypothetical protein IPP77_14880 [Bacteroidetes bacterium]|nr:hypothetical protein [Bacteroidota bacterium]